MESTSLVQKFINKLRFAKRSENTIKQYEPRLRKLDEYLKEKHNATLDDETGIKSVTGAMVEEWQMWLRDSGAGETTEAAYVSAAKSFFDWAARGGLVDRNPALSLMTVSVTKKEQPHLEWKDVEKLMETYDLGDWKRNRCILALGFIMALRVMSISLLNIGDVGDDKLRYVNKGGGIVTAYLPELVKDMVDQYIRAKRPSAKPEDPLFVNKNGGRLGIRSIQNICDDAGRLIGQKLTPHAMRRSSLTRVNEIQGRDMAQVVAAHSSGATTNRYLYDSRERMDSLYEDMNILSFGKKVNNVD